MKYMSTSKTPILLPQCPLDELLNELPTMTVFHLSIGKDGVVYIWGGEWTQW